MPPSCTFRETDLFLPPLWRDLVAWRAACRRVEGAEREALRAQLILIEQAIDAENLRSSPEALSWLLLWSRTFNLLDTLRAFIMRPATFGYLLLGRAALECAEQVEVIAEPLGEMPPPGLSRPDVVGRLRAYAAWCLHADPSRWESASELAARGDHRARLLEWLADPRLAAWFNLLDRVETSPGQRTPVAFHTLFGVDRARLAHRLGALGLGAAWEAYRSDTETASIEALTISGDGWIAPDVQDDSGECAGHADTIARVLQHVAVMLSVLRTQVMDPPTVDTAFGVRPPPSSVIMPSAVRSCRGT